MNKHLLLIATFLVFIFMLFGTVSAANAATNAAPKIISVYPHNNAVNIPTNQNIAIKFSEPIKTGNNYIVLKNSRGTAVPITKTISGNVLFIKHSSPLARGDKYTLFLHTGCVKDLTGKNSIAVTSSFTTDKTKPSIVSIDPVNNGVNVPIDKIIRVKFSENIKKGTNWIELKNSSGVQIPITKTIINNYLYIKHSVQLSREKYYYLIIHTNSITDISGLGVPYFSSKFMTVNGLNPNHPSSRVKITFIHHSSGGNWLSSGNLGVTLNRNNYYVTETDYGWDAQSGDALGDRTDTVNWPEWFTDQKMPYVYQNNHHSAYTNTISDPGGENEIIMFKSCFPNSEVGDSINDEKAIYNSIKGYFAAHPNKLFVLITPPGETDVSSYQLTKQLCNWLVDKNGWLNGYTGKNVMVFDFYGVLSETSSHHRYYNGQIQHIYSTYYDGISPYHDGDDHPNAIGNQKATTEFISLLNIAYNRWKT